MHSRTARTLRATFAVALGLVVVPTVADAAQLTVDDGTKADCPSAGFTSIQSAVTAAAPGDTVSICPGTYQEAAATGGSGIQVNKALTIKGAGSDLVTIRPPTGITPSNPQSVRDAFGNVISVTAGPTTISGVTVDASNPGGSGTVDAGVAFINAGNSALRNSRVALGQQVGISGTGIGVVAAVPAVATGSFQFTLANNLIQSYSKAGVFIDASDGSNAIQPTLLNATVTGNRIEGGGPAGDTPQGQQGLQVSGGATAQITGNTITLNRSADENGTGCTPATCVGASEGLLLFDQPDAARYNATTYSGNNIQGNGFGILVADGDGSLPPAGTNVDATNNYWGSPDGPTVVDFNTVATSSSDDGDQVQGPNQGVNYTPFSNRPLSLPTAPGNEPDAAPTVNITSPADGATVNPGTATTITATATDDIGVASVTFRKGNTVLATDSTDPYSATFTPSAAEAGTSQVITATATDSKGQTTTTAISVRVSSPGLTPTPTPPPPATPQDTPPTVSLMAPRKLKVGKEVTLTATATDPGGSVKDVVFYVGAKKVCTDSSSPYTCDYTPKRRDVGRTALIAIATDSAGQTATDIKSAKVKDKKKKKKKKK